MTRNKEKMLDNKMIVKVFRNASLDLLLLLRERPRPSHRRTLGGQITPYANRRRSIFRSARANRNRRVTFAPQTPPSPPAPPAPPTPSSSILARHIYSPSPSTSNGTTVATATVAGSAQATPATPKPFARMLVQNGRKD